MYTECRFFLLNRILIKKSLELSLQYINLICYSSNTRFLILKTSKIDDKINQALVVNSRFYQYIEKNKMEESVKVLLRGQQILLPIDSILNLKPLITQQTLKQIRLPNYLSKFKPQLDVLHSCIYYLISIEKNLQQSRSLDFRQQCLASISDYYIKHKMYFQLYEYGHLCGKILSIPIDKAMHIIYFLVYTRLASKPYINNLITQIQKKGTHAKKKTHLKSQKQFSIYSKSHESRHLTVFYDTNQIQTEILKKQLKSIMSPSSKQSKKMTKKFQNKRYFNLKKVYPDDSDLNNEGSHDEYLRSSVTSRVITIPVKVRQNQCSSVITRLKLKSGNIQCDNNLKKINMRRQKFNDWTESADKIDHFMSDCDLKENRRVEWGTSKHIFDKDQRNMQMNPSKHQKHPYEHYQEIAGHIRSKNDQLDSIRFQCIHHNKKSSINCFKQSSSQKIFDRGFRFTKNSLPTDTPKVQDIKVNHKKVQTYRQFKQNIVAQDYPLIESEIQNKVIKTASVSKFSDHGIQDQLINIITRKNDNLSVEDDNHMIFNKKAQSKFKLQKYKQDYRHFLKSQIFEKVKSPS